MEENSNPPLEQTKLSAQTQPKLEPSLPNQKKTAKKTAKKSAPKSKAKLYKFDSDLLRLVMQGNTSQFQLINLLGIDPAEFALRVRYLTAKKFLVRDSFDANVLRLGVKGYDLLKEQEEKTLKKTAGKLYKPPANALPMGTPNAYFASIPNPDSAQASEKEKQIPATQTPSQPFGPQEQGNSQEQNNEEKKEEYKWLDLNDLVKKYGPNGAQEKTRKPKQHPSAQTPSTFLEATQKKQAHENQALATKTPALENNAANAIASETCELCKTQFKTSVNPSENNAKYGHCFCGAAYHKDCFEGILESDSKCVRCGKQLRLSLDRQSEDAVKKIKNAFD